MEAPIAPRVYLFTGGCLDETRNVDVSLITSKGCSEFACHFATWLKDARIKDLLNLRSDNLVGARSEVSIQVTDETIQLEKLGYVYPSRAATA